jgi:hypothetical protein
MAGGRVKEILHTSKLVISPGNKFCHGDRDDHSISKGKHFLSIKSGLATKNYCLVCARKIISLGQSRIDALSTELEKIEVERSKGTVPKPA